MILCCVEVLTDSDQNLDFYGIAPNAHVLYCSAFQLMKHLACFVETCIKLLNLFLPNYQLYSIHAYLYTTVTIAIN